MAQQQQYTPREKAVKADITPHLAGINTLLAGSWNEEEVRLMWDSVAPEISPADFRLFLYRAKSKGLNPLLNEIYCQARWNKAAGKHTMTTITTIDGARKICDLTGLYDGSEVGYNYDDKGNMVSATATIHRRGCSHPFRSEARFDEYCQTDNDGNPAHMWKKMPFVMVGKCAVSAALRTAFPAAMAGMYTPEEMGQADNIVPVKIEYVPAGTADAPLATETTSVPTETTAAVTQTSGNVTVVGEHRIPRKDVVIPPAVVFDLDKAISKITRATYCEVIDKIAAKFNCEGKQFQATVVKPFFAGWFGDQLPGEAQFFAPPLQEIVKATLAPDTIVALTSNPRAYAESLIENSGQDPFEDLMLAFAESRGMDRDEVMHHMDAVGIDVTSDDDVRAYLKLGVHTKSAGLAVAVAKKNGKPLSNAVDLIEAKLGKSVEDATTSEIDVVLANLVAISG